MMRCERCNQGDRRPLRRAKLGERDGRVAVVLDVPIEECVACGDRWFAWEVAARLDRLLTELLANDAELVARHFESAAPAA